MTGAPKAEAVEVLTRFGLGDRLNQRPPKLSGGERKRVDIARAILKKSNFLIADEPLSDLDPESGSIVMESLTRHASGEGVLVYSTVEPAQARFASEVVEMNAK